MKKNDCYTCPYREKVPGSAHSQCNIYRDKTFAFDFSAGVASGEITGVYDDESDKPVLKFHPHGVRNGWCVWPINFDPVWVECYLPIENNDKE